SPTAADGGAPAPDSEQVDQDGRATVLDRMGGHRPARTGVGAGAPDDRDLEARPHALEAVRDDLPLRQGERGLALRLAVAQHRADTVIGSDLRPLTVEDRVRVHDQ